MDKPISSQRLLELVLGPVIRFLVRRGVVFQEFDQKARELFINAATTELRKSTSKINASRLSVVTGLQRREVVRYLNAPPKAVDQSISLPARVLNQWEQSREFTTKDGSPRVLRYEGEKNEFADLCGSVSKAINAGTLLFEFQRTGVAKITPHGIKLVRAVETHFDNSEKVHSMLGQDLDLLLQAADENISGRDAIPNHHTRTDYDNIYLDKMAEARAWILNEGRAFHKRVREYLSQLDQDVNPSADPQQPAGGKISITSASLATFPTLPVGQAVRSRDRAAN